MTVSVVIYSSYISASPRVPGANRNYMQRVITHSILDLARLSRGFNITKKTNLLTLVSPGVEALHLLKLRRQLTVLLRVPDIAPCPFPRRGHACFVWAPPGGNTERMLCVH